MQFQGLLGVFALLCAGYFLSENRRIVPWRIVFRALLAQVGLAVLFLHFPIFQSALELINQAALSIQKAAEAGSSLVFGFLGGAPLPFTESYPGASFVLAFKALPIVIVMSALSALLFYWRILPLLIRSVAWLLKRALGVKGAVGMASAANVFIGMVEAPLTVRPYVNTMSRSDLFLLMSVGMATVAGTVMVLYATILSPIIDNALGHVLVASLVSAPAAILFSIMMVPPMAQEGKTEVVALESSANSSIDAISNGTEEGLKLFLNIIAMLLVLVSLVTLFNSALQLLPDVGGTDLSAQRILGWLMAPLMWLLGLPWQEALVGGQLMGIKTVLNEFLAYLQLAEVNEAVFSDRSTMILTYALCGFANFGSLGIMVAGLTTMAPQRRAEILQLGPRSLVSGTLATCLTGALAGLITI